MASDMLFSQIPGIIISKANVHSNRTGPKSKKKLRFADDVKEEETIVEDKPQQNRIDCKPKSVDNFLDDTESSSDIIDVESIRDEPSSSSNSTELRSKKETSDAIIQANIAPETRNQKVQTDESFLTRPLSMSDYESHRNHNQAQFVEVYKPMFAMPRRPGREPPLKIGLTLPKGKKRKVFYPDEEEENIKVA